MMRTTLFSLAFLLAGCPKVEEDIDRTIIKGNLVIPPAAVDESADAGDNTNDSWETADELPMLTYRETTVSGTSAFFGSGQVAGDQDYYLFSSKFDGDLNLVLDFTTDSGLMGDLSVLNLHFYDFSTVEEECVEDPDCDPKVEECTEICTKIPTATYSSDGLLGHVEVTMSVLGGGDYGLLIDAASSTEYDDGMTYTMQFESFTPEDDELLVGAYLSDDPQAHGNPVGGASVYDIQWDATQSAWVGRFEILYLKEVNSTSEVLPGDTAATEDHEVIEGVPKVWLMGGTLPTLNASIPSGALYSSTAVEVSTGDGDDTIGDWGDTAATDDTGAVPVPTGDIVVVIDALQPRVVGWEHTEVEPNNVATDVNTNEIAVDELEGADLLPASSGPGFVDIIYGNTPFETEAPTWAEDVDVFQFEITEPVNASISLAWDDCATDLDLHIYDEEGTFYALSWYDCPELIDTAAWEFSLDSSHTWYIFVLPYAGSIGDHEYTIEIEYAGI